MKQRKRFLVFSGIAAALFSLFAVFYASDAPKSAPLHVIQSKPDGDIPGFTGIKESQLGNEFLRISMENGMPSFLCQSGKGNLSQALGIESSGPLKTITTESLGSIDIFKALPGERLFLLSSKGAQPLVCAIPERIGIGLGLQVGVGKKNFILHCNGGSPSHIFASENAEAFRDSAIVQASDLIERLRRAKVGNRLRVRMGQYDLYCQVK